MARKADIPTGPPRVSHSRIAALHGGSCAGVVSSIVQSKACAKVSWRDSAGSHSCPAKVSRPAGIDVGVSGGNE